MNLRPKDAWTARFLLRRAAALAVAVIFASGTGAAQERTPAGGPMPRTASLPTLFLAGDSTVHNGDNGQVGWGEPLAAYFLSAKIHVVNQALGGRSSRTFLTEGHWSAIVSLLQPGDVVLIQFGHNDGGAIDDPTRARASLPGAGEEEKEIANPLTGQRETVHTYGWYLRKYVADAKSRGAIPIVCSPVPMNNWKDGKVVRVASTYGGWARQVAAGQGASFLDLNQIVAQRYDAMGQSKVNALFQGTQTVHTNQSGAELNAESVIRGLKVMPNDPLAKYFSAKAAGIAAAAD